MALKVAFITVHTKHMSDLKGQLQQNRECTRNAYKGGIYSSTYRALEIPLKGYLQQHIKALEMPQIRHL